MASNTASNANFREIKETILDIAMEEQWKPQLPYNSRKAELEGIEFEIHADVFNDTTIYITAIEYKYGFTFSDDQTAFKNKAEADTFKQRFEDTNNTISLWWLNDKKGLSFALRCCEDNVPFVYVYELRDNVYPSLRQQPDVCLGSVSNALKTDDLASMKELYIKLVREFNNYRSVYYSSD